MITSFEDVLKGWSNRAVGELVNVSLPGVVLSYDSVTQTATVKPVIREAFEEDDEVFSVDFEPIPSVPVAHWRAGDFAIHSPLKAGDFVTLLVQDRSIDEFMATGGTDVTPQDLRRFDWTDAVALPMPMSPTPIAGLLDDRMVIGSPDANMVLTEAGGMALTAGDDELFAVLTDLLDKLIPALNGMGSTTFDPASQAELVAIKVRLTSMKAV